MTQLLDSLRVRRVLRDTPRRSIVLLEGDDGEKFVLKRYRDARGGARERAFLRASKTTPFLHLRLPRIVEEGERHILLEYIARDTTPDIAGFERAWSPTDVRLWVDALLEFQETRLLSQLFTWRQKVAGTLYPVWRTLWLVHRFRGRVPRRLLSILPALIASYAWARPRFQSVQTHYDLHGENYGFARVLGKMSMLDFELPYFRGDPLFDVWYRLVLSATRFEDWSIQAVLLREYVARAKQKNHRMVGFLARSRLVALQCTLGCLLYHHDRDELRRHAANLDLLMDARRFRSWLDSILRVPARG